MNLGLIQDDISKSIAPQKSHQLEEFKNPENHPKTIECDPQSGSNYRIFLCWRTIFLKMSSGAPLALSLIYGAKHSPSPRGA